MRSRPDVQRLCDDALARRSEMLAREDLTACRLFHGAADGLAGFVLERFGDVLVAQLHTARTEDESHRRPSGGMRQVAESVAKGLAGAFMSRLGARAVYRKLFVRDRAREGREVDALHHDAKPWIGEPVESAVTIVENGLGFVVRPYDGFSVGLFLENRDNRRRVRELAAGRRVLNTFAYTCGFSVAAAAGGAVRTDSVDLHKRYLEWGRENFAANGIDLAENWFFASDTLDFYRRARRQGRRYDLIILDPPTFSRTRRPARTFVLEEQLEALCQGALELLDPGGILLVSINDRGISAERLEEAACGGASRRTRVLERPQLPPDFPGDPDYAKSILVQVE